MTKFLILLLIFSGFVRNAYTQPANDDCIDAIQLSNLNNGCVDFNSTMATFDIVNGDCVPNQSSRNLWFSFIAQGPEIDISAEGGANEVHLTLLAFDPSPCVFASAIQLNCGSATGGNTAISIDFLTPGNTYYIAVAIGNDTEASGSFCINNPDPNAVVAFPSFRFWQIVTVGFLLLTISLLKLNASQKLLS